ncbi:hypothetical protein [Enterobacter bugandensis]|uniref:hypothetical protein n=1 Tax=Enterobacter bugandensis TaxID=881260 RepID=UPI0021D0EECF|nr:hypothetical protein [Enterobacter bugandensis]MCU6216481.1 hypothetical protein [Enterobacter bugandensis]
MTKSKKPRAMTVMLDVELTEAVRKVREEVISQLDEAGVNGPVAAPSMGYVARSLLRSKLGLPANALDHVYKP